MTNEKFLAMLDPQNPDNVSMLLNAHRTHLCSLGGKGRNGLAGCKTVALLSDCSQIL